MVDLKRELQFQHNGLKIAMELRYITHLIKHVGKLHSTVIIVLTNHDYKNKLTKLGIREYEELHYTGTYLTI